MTSLIGVGTTTPNYNVDINGNFHCSSTGQCDGNFKLGKDLTLTSVTGSITQYSPTYGYIYITQGSGEFDYEITCNNYLLNLLNTNTNGTNVMCFGQNLGTASSAIFNFNGVSLQTPATVGIGKTPNTYALDVSGSINTNSVVTNYSSLPTLSSNSIGYNGIYNYSGSLSFSSSAILNIPIISLPVGYYLVNAYFNANFTATSQTSIQLGLNTISTGISATYNPVTVLIAPITASGATISYVYYLSNSLSSNTWYVVFLGHSTTGTLPSLTAFNVNVTKVAKYKNLKVYYKRQIN